MKAFAKSALGIFVGMLIGTAFLLPFHLKLFARETTPGTSPAINVDNTPIVRDVKAGNSFAPVVKKAAPSVVNIYSTHIVRFRRNPMPFEDDPFFRQFFGAPDNRELTRKEQSLGSGVIVSADGYILTASHVVRDADEIKVALGANDDKKYDAKVVGTDPQTDVAVLKIQASGLPAVTLGNSEQLEVGDVVLAIGNPFGVGQTVTMGIISALGRHYKELGGYQNFIQTDAAINPGNSGGALIDTQGRLIGINTWIASSSGGSEGVGFAVPVNMARHVMENLIAGGKVSRGYLGIYPQDITPRLAKAFSLGNGGGVLIGDVFPGTPADKAGIKRGDIVTEFNGKSIPDAHTLTLMISDCAPGTDANLKVVRDGVSKTFSIKLGEHPGSLARNGNGPSPASSDTDALDGVIVRDLDDRARGQLEVPINVKGALVVDVQDDSNAADAGLHKGDIIIEINHQPVANADEAVKLCNQAKGDQLLLAIWRREGDFAMTAYLTVDNAKRDKK